MKILRNHLLLYLLIVLQQKVLATDYCKTKCGEKHLACQYKDRFGPRCFDPKRLMDMKAYKEIILRLHNLKRNIVAGGKEKFPTASHMGEMVWDDELAYLSQVKVQQCRLWEDTCRSTKRYPNPGRNGILMRWWNNKPHSDGDIIIALISEWLQQSKFADKNMVASYRKSKSQTQNYVSFFALAIMESNNRIGCAASVYMNGEGEKTFLFNCFYPRDLERGSMLYSLGPPACACKWGLSANYSNLCAIDEAYAYERGSKMLTTMSKPLVKFVLEPAALRN